MPYLLESWDLDSACHPDVSARFADHLGALLVQVLSPDEFVAVISIPLLDQFSGFSTQLLSGEYFCKFNIFFDFER
jgi:hypothetical protein